MKRLFTMGLALLMVLTMVPMSCHASNLDAGIGAESVMLASMTVSAVAVDKPVDMGDNQDSSEDWRVVTEEDDPLSLIIDILDSCGIRYEIPIDALDTIFTSKVMTTPISPTINETIRLVELIPNDFDISESISVEIIFGDQDDAFSSLGNA